MANKTVVIDSTSASRNSNKVEDLEKEIAELEAAALGEAEEEEEEVIEEEQKQAPKPKKVKEPDDEEEVLNKEEETFKKRYGDSRRFIQQLQDQIKELKDGPPALSNPPASEEDLTKWIADNPEIASIVETIAVKKAEDRFEGADKRLKDIDDERFELKREKAENFIRKEHDDYDEIKEDDSFHGWASEQPNVIQDALYKDPEDWRSVARVIDMYKSDKGLTKKDQQEDNKRAAMATDIKGDSKPSGKKIIKWSESKVERLSVDDYMKYEEEIDKAINSNEFIYDLSGR
jgi:hypothetical protein